jgi:hypothetical protein
MKENLTNKNIYNYINVADTCIYLKWENIDIKIIIKNLLLLIEITDFDDFTSITTPDNLVPMK